MLKGHVTHGLGFLVIGLWHIFNHIRLHARSPNLKPLMVPWFPAPKIRHLELYMIILVCSGSISGELGSVIRNGPLDSSGTIPTNHLHNFEHSIISVSFFTYAVFAIVFDWLAGSMNGHSKALFDLTQLLGTLAFGQELLLFHFHSADHMGLEGHYHFMFQIVITVSLVTTLIGIGVPGSFVVVFVRSVSIFFQGVWLIVMGFMLWTPELIPDGCLIKQEERLVVRCHSDEALQRAKSLANMLFSMSVIGVTVFSVTLNLVFLKIYKDRIKYHPIDAGNDDADIKKSGKTLDDVYDKTRVGFMPRSSYI